jgi:hypothetical protein
MNTAIYQFRHSAIRNPQFPISDDWLRDFDKFSARDEFSQMRVKRLVWVLIFLVISLVAGCTYLMTMPASNPHSQYDGPRPWATPWKSPAPP